MIACQQECSHNVVCVAYFYSVYPDKGPLEGGTTIRFNASIINEETRPTRVHFYDDTQRVHDLPLSLSDTYEHDRFHSITVMTF